MNELTKQLKAVIIERDGNKCRKCGTSQYLTVDHILPRSEGGTNDFSNLETLCRVCHSRKDNPGHRKLSSNVSKEYLEQIVERMEKKRSEYNKERKKKIFILKKLTDDKAIIESNIGRCDKIIHESKLRLRAFELSTPLVYVEMPK